MSQGCGRFSQDEWVDLVTARQGDPKSPLAVHIEACPECRAEVQELRRLGAGMRDALADPASLKESFVNSVVADVNRTAQQPIKSKPLPRSRTVRRRLPVGPAALAAAAAGVVLVIFLNTFLPWDLDRNGSTGYTVPGGTILTLSESTAAHGARVLTPRGIAVADAAGSDSSASTVQALDSAHTGTHQRPEAALPILSSRGVAQGNTVINGG